MKHSGNYVAIYNALDPQLDVAVANPRQTNAIGTSEVKNDRLDAKLLAQLCRAELVAESYVPAEDIRELRTLAHGRKLLVLIFYMLTKKEVYNPPGVTGWRNHPQARIAIALATATAIKI